MRAAVFTRSAVALALLTLSTTSAVHANPVLLFEPATGLVLHAEDPDRSWHPASVTKLMTAYLTFEAVKTGRLAWDSNVPLSDNARGQPATRIGLKGGIKLNVEQAIRGLILRSANDFATALAETVGGTEEKFIELMNDTAKHLGMSRSRFKNPHGLPDPEQVTTARDMALLTAALLRDFPDRAEVFSTPTVLIHKGTFHSQNDLLRDVEGGDGMKTGFTCASGYNVVASATRNGRQLVAVVLGAVNRTTRSERATDLIEAGFTQIAGGKAAEAAAASHAKSALSHSAKPVTLKDLALTPAEPVPPYDMTRETRTGKCGNSSRVARRAPKTVAKAETAQAAPTIAAAPVATAAAVVTGSVQKIAKPKPRPAAKPRDNADGAGNSVQPLSQN